ncbi:MULTISPECIES: bifunctional DNA primase/polymerase [Kitasatospora]|uniref:Bifunctional DNA primase/polymerase n=1 Tax=Kitasatospora cathayae TaxID=3004092 RepID=A0ABY7Q297_9ACTN|nr:bifunctional DNA primase/polymerase [Kitasatospora sp. HUAS 3-15]WBP86823.1 bifunctional DNA primase/polymerase [Kitasatospora sp. HUAS 3-15]
MDNLFGELRLGHLRLAPLGARRRTKVTASQAAAEYTGRWGWAVATGETAGGTAGSVLFPTGRAFDVLDVPEQAGLQALVRLERMGTQIGPVLAPPTGRMQFLVAAGTARRLPDLLYRMGWDDAALDLACHGEGSCVAAPPTVLGELGPVRWLRRPTRDNAGCPPEARLLLGTLAYACHRSRERTAEPAWMAS